MKLSAIEPATERGKAVLAALFFTSFILFGGGLYFCILHVPVLSEDFHWSRAATSSVLSSTGATW